jgi:hypothetical protein
MSGYSEPPITFGSSGGLVWPLRAAARGGAGAVAGAGAGEARWGSGGEADGTAMATAGPQHAIPFHLNEAKAAAFPLEP